MRRKRYAVYQQTGPETTEFIGRVWACDEAMPFADDLEWQRSPWVAPLYTIVEERMRSGARHLAYGGADHGSLDPSESSDRSRALNDRRDSDQESDAPGDTRHEDTAHTCIHTS